MKILSLIISGILIIIIVYFLFVGNGIFGIQDIYLKNSKDFDNFVEYFLSQNEIKNMIIRLDKKENKCEIVNHWGRCPILDVRWSKETGGVIKGIPQEMFLSSLEEVLAYEKISKKNYDYIANFLKKYGFRAIGRDNERSVIDISFDLDGLRYYKDLNNNFEVDKEFIQVKRINDHWFKFRSDWN